MPMVMGETVRPSGRGELGEGGDMRKMLGLVLCGVVAAPALAQVGRVASPTFGRPMSVGNQAPAAPAPFPLQGENLQSFDPKALQIVWANRHWLLTSGGEVVKDFGTHEQEARQALTVIRELGLTQHGVVGGPTPAMEYWLADGQAPRGLPRAGLRATSLTPSALEVAQVQGQWCLRDKARVLFNFGQHADDAHQALGVIRKYQFDQVGVLGQVSPSMYVFLSRGAGDASPSLPPTRGVGTGRVLEPPHFSRLAKNKDGSPRAAAPAPASGLAPDGLAASVVPPLANRAADRAQDQPRPFQWQAKPPANQAAAEAEAGRVPFDWRRASLVQEQGEWRIKSGGLVLANFGPSAHDARTALSALRHYRFTEQVRLGGDTPYLTYFLAGGAAPRGVPLGVRAEEFKPDQLELKQVVTGYALCQGPRVVLQLRESQGDGKKLLESIQRNRCDRVCRIGEPGKEAMTFLVRSR
ncbi:MAG: hypothetical protein U0797_28610 [Gemmataceae bacterium]